MIWIILDGNPAEIFVCSFFEICRNIECCRVCSCNWSVIRCIMEIPLIFQNIIIGFCNHFEFLCNISKINRNIRHRMFRKYNPRRYYFDALRCHIILICTKTILDECFQLDRTRHSTDQRIVRNSHIGSIRICN